MIDTKQTETETQTYTNTYTETDMHGSVRGLVLVPPSACLFMLVCVHEMYMHLHTNTDAQSQTPTQTQIDTRQTGAEARIARQISRQPLPVLLHPAVWIPLSIFPMHIFWNIYTYVYIHIYYM